MSELVVADHKPKSIYGNSLTYRLDQFKDKPNIKKSIESARIFGKEVKIDPENMKVNRHLLAYVTNAKEPIKRVRNRSDVI